MQIICFLSDYRKKKASIKNKFVVFYFFKTDSNRLHR